MKIVVHNHLTRDWKYKPGERVHLLGGYAKGVVNKRRQDAKGGMEYFVTESPGLNSLVKPGWYPESELTPRY